MTLDIAIRQSSADVAVIAGPQGKAVKYYQSKGWLVSEMPYGYSLAKGDVNQIYSPSDLVANWKITTGQAKRSQPAYNPYVKCDDEEGCGSSYARIKKQPIKQPRRTVVAAPPVSAVECDREDDCEEGPLSSSPSTIAEPIKSIKPIVIPHAMQPHITLETVQAAQQETIAMFSKYTLHLTSQKKFKILQDLLNGEKALYQKLFAQIQAASQELAVQAYDDHEGARAYEK